MRDQRNKLTVERLKKQVNEARERNQELHEERENVMQAIKSLGLHEEDKEEDGDRFEQDQTNLNNKSDGQSWKRPKQINFYEPVNEDPKEVDVIDASSGSHSPHFGAGKADFLGGNNIQHTHVQQINNFTKPSYNYDEPEGSDGKENVSEDEEPAEDEAEPGEDSDSDFNPSKYDMVFPPKYHNDNDDNKRIVQENVSADGKIVRWYAHHKKEVIFKKGVRKEIFPDGYTIVKFKNNDIKQTYPDGKIVYYFEEAQTTQTTDTDGVHIYKFSNGQIEKHFPDGTKEIRFPDGIVK
jgi:centromere protein J